LKSKIAKKIVYFFGALLGLTYAIALTYFWPIHNKSYIPIFFWLVFPVFLFFFVRAHYLYFWGKESKKPENIKYLRGRLIYLYFGLLLIWLVFGTGIFNR